jgi:hypothetical protein
MQVARVILADRVPDAMQLTPQWAVQQFSHSLQAYFEQSRHVGRRSR